MSQDVILGVAVVAGLACPAHMWWSRRRGSRTACCPPMPKAETEGEIETLRARQERLGALIAEHEAALCEQARPPHETPHK